MRRLWQRLQELLRHRVGIRPASAQPLPGPAPAASAAPFVLALPAGPPAGTGTELAVSPPVIEGDEHEPQKFCKDCRYCHPETDKYIKGVDKLVYASCQHPSARLMTDSEYAKYLVTAVYKRGETRFHYCTTMRQVSCGEEARFFSPRDK